MSEIVSNVFVYGTLMPGESNYRQIEDFVIDYKPGAIDGVLVDLGAYPALVPGEGIVKGIMLRVKQEALEITDRIEGYHADRDRCLYVREEVAVRFEDGRETVAWTYLFANSAGIADCPRLVVGESDEIPVFAWRPQ
ncbi:MAG: gamma-glutamylcyclotransferase [Planctomycetes bacterium]|nr:gamma-glutamylcyclotransferase [Planctomycetota bacterium]